MKVWILCLLVASVIFVSSLPVDEWDNCELDNVSVLITFFCVTDIGK